MVKGYPLVLIVPLVSVNGRRVESTPTKPRAIGNISFPHDVFYQRNTKRSSATNLSIGTNGLVDCTPSQS